MAIILIIDECTLLLLPLNSKPIKLQNWSRLSTQLVATLKDRLMANSAMSAAPQLNRALNMISFPFVSYTRPFYQMNVYYINKKKKKTSSILFFICILWHLIAKRSLTSLGMGQFSLFKWDLWNGQCYGNLWHSHMSRYRLLATIRLWNSIQRTRLLPTVDCEQGPLSSLVAPVAP